MPQISQLAATYASQIFWVLLFFGLVYFVIGRGMVPKVMATVDARDKQIADDLAAAEAARKSADEQEEAWRQRAEANRADAQKRIQEAKDKSTRETEATLAKADAEISTHVGAAEARIAAASAKAMGEIETVAVDAAQDMVARLSGAKVSAADATAAVKAVLSNV